MKSLNTKKIVAMATGAALLGSALLGAVSYQNTELINENGVPMAKVVVGSNAHISDGVAAANIAAVLGNMAFKSVAVEATVSGIDGLSCDVSGEGAGTCSVLSKSVDLEVVTPAGVIPAGSHAINTYIWDWIDSETKDRDTSTDTDRRIRAQDFPPLADYAVNDPQSAFNTVQKQEIYVRSGLVEFDNAGDEVFRAENVNLRYEIKFESPGLPICTDDYDVNNCDERQRLDNHRVHVKFMGEEWIVSEMNDNNDGTITSIKLAKESSYSPKLQIGESMDLGDGNTLVLGDLKPASGAQEEDIAIFSVFNAAGEEIASRTVMAGNTVEVVAGAHTYRIRVYQAAPGYTLTEKWAEVAVFANELELEDASLLENNDGEIGWMVDLESAPSGNKLTKIILTRDSDLMETGDSFNIVEDPTIWRFTFTGITLGEDDYERVRVTSQSATASTRWYDCKVAGAGDYSNRRDCQEHTIGSEHMIRLSASSDIFRFHDTVLNSLEETSDIYIVVFGDSANITAGDTFYWRTGVGYVPIKNAYLYGEYGGNDFDRDVEYDDGERMQDLIINDEGTYSGAAGGDLLLEVGITEYQGDSTHYMGFNVIEGSSSNRWIFDADGDASTENDQDHIWYNPSGVHGAATFYEIENIGYSARGSYITNMRSSSLDMYLAKEVAELQFLLQSTGAEVTEEGAVQHPNLKEGDEVRVMGATVRVKNINVETSACEVEGGEGVVTGVEGLSCVINANVANLGERQDIPTDLVVMDRAAANVETVIAVGGPMVNDVTAALLATESPLQSAGDVFVEEVGAGKIVVAGYTADDTMTAAMNFIAALKGQ